MKIKPWWLIVATLLWIGIVAWLSACAPKGATVATIWEDTFESGNPITTSYTIALANRTETNATCGKDGGWGARSNRATYGDYFKYLGAQASESAYYRLEFDTDWSYLDQDAGGTFIEMVGVWSGNWRYLNLDHADGDAGNTGLELTISNDVVGSDYVIGVAAGAITPGTWQRVMLEVWFSTWTGASPNADGRAKVWVDDVCVISGTGLTLLSKAYGQTSSDVDRIGRVDFFTLGAYDNLLLTTDPLPLAVWVDIANYVEQEIPASAFPGGAARVLGDLWTEDTGSPLPVVKARLYNVTDGASAGESAEVSSATPTACDFGVTLASGTKRYTLQVTSDTPNIDIFYCGRGVGP